MASSREANNDSRCNGRHYLRPAHSLLTAVWNLFGIGCFALFRQTGKKLLKLGWEIKLKSEKHFKHVRVTVRVKQFNASVRIFIKKAVLIEEDKK